MQVTVESIQALKPCKPGIDNFIEHYPNFKGSVEDVLSLEHISYSDKIWYACEVVNYKILQQWSVECTEFVVDNYNSQYPNDSRVSDCIEMSKRYLLNECTLEELNTARSAAWSAAWYAAGSAESAAESAATRSARSAARSAAKSATWYAGSATTEKEQEDINLSLLIALVENA